MEDFLRIVREKYDIFDSKKVEQAYKLATIAHEGNKRESGSPWVVHNISVAKILLDMNMDADTVCAGLLHDLLDETDATIRQISDAVEGDVAELVKGLSKINSIKFRKDSTDEVEKLRRLIMSMGKDIRVVIIKIADRLHNMRTIEYLPRERQIKYASETKDVFSGLAERLGLSKIKSELDDLCFKTLKPEEYAKLEEELTRKYSKWQEKMKRISGVLEYVLREMGIKGKISSRFKNFYSLYKKFQTKGTEKIYDIIAFRILVENVEDCYRVLGAVHQKYQPVPGRIKDYIAAPKQNGYQSLHTTLITADRTPFELQIRTYDMHEYCENGIASHWNYKGDTDKSSLMQEQLSWLKSLLETDINEADNKDLIKTLQMDFSLGEIWVFTPKYKPINLPECATPIDFAYAVHTELGHKCIGAKVNGKKVSLAYTLETGDVVEIITSNECKGPSRDWLNVVNSKNSRYCIKQFFRRETTPENIIFGKKILEEEASNFGLTLGDIIDEENFSELKEKFSFESLDDMFAAVGYKGVTVNQILKPTQSRKDRLNSDKVVENSPILVEDRETSKFRLSLCCSPVPGDDIVAIANRDTYGIHTTDCKNQKYIDTDRYLKASWNTKCNKQFIVHVGITSQDEDGILQDILSLIYKSNIACTALNAQVMSDNKFEMTVTIKVHNKKELDEFIGTIKQNVPAVEHIARKNLA